MAWKACCFSRDGDRTLIISVDAIQRSLAVRVEGYEVEAL